MNPSFLLPSHSFPATRIQILQSLSMEWRPTILQSFSRSSVPGVGLLRQPTSWTKKLLGSEPLLGVKEPLFYNRTLIIEDSSMCVTSYPHSLNISKSEIRNSAFQKKKRARLSESPYYSLQPPQKQIWEWRTCRSFPGHVYTWSLCLTWNRGRITKVDWRVGMSR